MKTKKKYLPLYENWFENGRIPYVDAKNTKGGLCSIFGDDQIFDLFKPECHFDGYWGFAEDYRVVSLPDLSTKFTPLRQTIVLFMAAMNGEL